MRLDRFLSQTTGMSRKEATRVLQRETITVDGVVQKKGAFKVPEGAEVIWNDMLLEMPGPTYRCSTSPQVVCAPMMIPSTEQFFRI